MKLNNRGWGLQALLIFILIFLIALIIIAILVHQTFGSLIKPLNSDEKNYEELENIVVESAKKYQIKYYDDLVNNQKVYVTIKELQKEKLLDSLYDIDDNTIECSGYVEFIKEDKINYYPYIKCGNNYTTKGYTNSYDSK